MKIIRSQNKLSLVNAKHIFHIEAEDEVDENDLETGNIDIAIHFDAHGDSFKHTVATYSTTEECIQNLDKLAVFLSSDEISGLFNMP